MNGTNSGPKAASDGTPDAAELSRQMAGNWAEIAEKSQRLVGDFLQRQGSGGEGGGGEGGIGMADPLAIGAAFFEMTARMMSDPAKLVEAQLASKVKITTVPMSGRFTIGPFDLELVTLTHSIPEPNAVVIRTPVGTVLHTGDWKLDPDPLVGSPTDENRLRAVGDEGVLAIVCDSTNALREGRSGSEGELRQHLTELIGRYDGRVAVACFASNVARLSTIAYAAAANGRNVALIGRSLWRIDRAARENGYLADLPRFLTEDEAGYVPRDKIVLICTGSQGEPRAALARIARDDHPHIVLEEGDVVIFSSRIIPGNEKAISRLHNALLKLRVEVVRQLVEVGEVPPAFQWFARIPPDEVTPQHDNLQSPDEVFDRIFLPRMK